MVRAPCCEKIGLTKGPWTPEEDLRLIAYIQRYGHGNWRALPKQAGLLRCGKSCRLRWTNYLRPDIKRGNFTRDEEETIIKLHELLGNRWSTIAARLPGRTDNEIKNVWHTHLKKRLHQNPSSSVTGRYPLEVSESTPYLDLKPANFPNQQKLENPRCNPVSPQQSLSDLSSIVTSENHTIAFKDECVMEFDGNYWSGTLSLEDQSASEDFSVTVNNPQLQFPLSSNYSKEIVVDRCRSNDNESMEFWFNLLMEAGSLMELPEILK